MAENILEKADAQVAESIYKLSHATSAMADAMDEGVGVIKRIVKRSCDVAERSSWTIQRNVSNVTR